ncbi:MAG: hypothetical protein ACJKTH_02915 [Patescibacteria group bacterium UBA2163]
MIIDVFKIFFPAVIAFVGGLMLTPFLTHYLYKYRAWKKTPGKIDLGGQEAKVFNTLHKDRETKTPRMGGVVIWLSAFITIMVIWVLAQFFPFSIFEKLDFLSRSQTWIPLSLFLFGSFVGLIDDLLEIRASKGFSQGLSIQVRLAVVGSLALAAGIWFFTKLDVVSIGIPFFDPLVIGWLIVPLFVMAALFIYASGVIDGIDGLAGGVFATIFAAYAGVAFFQNQIDLAAFSATISGATLAFLWFNIPPARFYMSETGTMGLTLALVTIAFMTDTLGDGHGFLALGIIAFPLIATVCSNILQVLSKKIRNGKKLFKVAPLHHHFEAIGWPSYKVTMRYWVLSVMFAIIGIAFALLG